MRDQPKSYFQQPRKPLQLLLIIGCHHRCVIATSMG